VYTKFDIYVLINLPVVFGELELLLGMDVTSEIKYKQNVIRYKNNNQISTTYAISAYYH
jgi:hypothetical protein